MHGRRWQADIAAFTKEILVKCGDVNELTYCSWTCTQALQTYSDSVGCCWESVLQGYEVLDGNAGQAWRNWQVPKYIGRIQIFTAC